MFLFVFDLRIEGGAMYPHVRQFETRALEVEAEIRLARERTAARPRRRTAKQSVGWSRVLSTGRAVPPALGDCPE